ncbi:MAG: HAD family hydrolase [Betaproteobacteria bacterium]
MIRAVLIDLDDTLVDHHHAVQAALRALHTSDLRLQSLGFEFLVAEWQRVLEEMHDDVALGRIPIHESRIIRYRHFYALAGVPVDRAEAEHIAAGHMQTYMASRRVVPGAAAFLAALRPHVRTAVVTNNTVIEQDEKLATFGLWPHVDALVTSEECRTTKPDPAIFRTALQRLDVDADEAVMVGDSWRNDVVGATACGIRAVWLNRHGAPCPDPALAIEVHSLEPVAHTAALVIDRPL